MRLQLQLQKMNLLLLLQSSTVDGTGRIRTSLFDIHMDKHTFSTGHKTNNVGVAVENTRTLRAEQRNT